MKEKKLLKNKIVTKSAACASYKSDYVLLLNTWSETQNVFQLQAPQTQTQTRGKNKELFKT
jgi:hypothetical protein